MLVHVPRSLQLQAEAQRELFYRKNYLQKVYHQSEGLS